MTDFIETRIISAVRGLLSGKVNDLLSKMEHQIPLIEFSDYRGGTAVVPVISLFSSELTEKERIIRLEAYSLTLTFDLPETPESELFCYAYSRAVSRAIYEDPTLDGITDRAVITGKKYIPPKKPNCGEGWGLVIALRLTIEENI